MRLFLAIDLPESIQEQIAELYLPHWRQVRWQPLGQLHITLVFIGDTPAGLLDEIIEVVSEVEFSPFTLQLEGIGHFRSGAIWLGVKIQPLLVQLQRQLKSRLADLPLQLEHRKYLPHITLGRCKHLGPELLTELETHSLGFSCSFICDSFQLKSSRLKPEGAFYQTEAEFYPDD